MCSGTPLLQPTSPSDPILMHPWYGALLMAECCLLAGGTKLSNRKGSKLQGPGAADNNYKVFCGQLFLAAAFFVLTPNKPFSV